MPLGMFFEFLSVFPVFFFAEAFGCALFTSGTDKVCEVCTLLHLRGKSCCLINTSGAHNAFWESGSLYLML